MNTRFRFPFKDSDNQLLNNKKSHLLLNLKLKQSIYFKNKIILLPKTYLLIFYSVIFFILL